MRDLRPSHLALSLALLAAACTKGDPALGPPSPASLATCSAVATLYPRARMSDTAIRDELIAKLWARRDGGMGPIHGPPEKWRRNTDLRFAGGTAGVTLSYEETHEATGKEPATKAWSEDCQICGEVLVCGQQAWALRLRTNAPPSGNELRILDTQGVLELGDHDLYLIRDGHEIYLDFEADPRTTSTGALNISVRKLEAGAERIGASTRFETKDMVMSYGGRSVMVELPGDLDRIKIDYPPERPPAVTGNGVEANRMRRDLYEYETLKRNPQLTDQPKSLELSDSEAKGFQPLDD